MNSNQEEKYMQILNHAEQLRKELSTMPIAIETDILFIDAVDMLNEQQTTIAHQSALLAKAVEALEFTQDKLLCDETYNSKLIKDKIQAILAEITKGDDNAK